MNDSFVISPYVTPPAIAKLTFKDGETFEEYTLGELVSQLINAFETGESVKIKLYADKSKSQG